MANRNRLIFDIETIGHPFEELGSDVQEFLLRYADTDEKKQQVRDGTALSAITGEIVAIALLDPDTDKGGVYFQAPDAQREEWVEDGVRYVPATEAGLLNRFWQTVANYGQIVTFNGRGFDAPFIYLRSMVHEIKATKDLMPYRYDPKQHLDLQDQLKFYGANRMRFDFHVLCRMLGVESPKDAGVAGGDVPELFSQGEHETIARYCLRDVRATQAVLAKWDRVFGAD